MVTPRHRTLNAATPTGHDGTRGDPGTIVAGGTDALGTLVAALSGHVPGWHEAAACRGSGIDFTSRAPAQRAAALALCGQCTQREPCLAWAIEVDDGDAILGGMDPAARKAHARTVAARQRAKVNDK
jgi:hypothetical protein